MKFDSPFEQYFDSDYAPTTEEIYDIKKIIDKRQAIVDDIDAKIEELDRQRQELVEEKKRHTNFIGRHHNLTTVVRGVPTDILSTIFLTLLSMSPSASSPHPSIAISHVCHQWRRLALTMPLLWTRINLSTPTPAPHEEQTSRLWIEHARLSSERATAFIHRAGASLLDIEIDIQDPFDDAMSKQLAPVEGSGHGIVHRMTEALGYCDDTGAEFGSARLSLKVNPSMPISLLYLHILQLLYASRLTVEISYIKRGPVVGNMWEIMRNTITLTDNFCTSLNLRMRYEDLARVDANWDTLTDLSMGPESNGASVLYAQQVIPILTQTTNLNRLSLELRYFIEHQDPPLPSRPRAQLPKLRTLELRADFLPLWFTTSLDIPSLTHLSVRSPVTEYRRARDASPLVALLQECGHQLVDLSFEHDTLDQDALPFALGLVPNVEVLELTSTRLPPMGPEESQTLDSTLNALHPTHDETEPCLIPNLRVLVCDLCQATSEVRNDVLGLIQARRKTKSAGGPVRWLEEVEVRFRKGSVDGMFEELRDRGVDTTLIRFISLGE